MSADWIILPGSKQVSGDLQWLRQQGLDAAIDRHAAVVHALFGTEVPTLNASLDQLAELADRNFEPGML
jgi:hypothetical protein